MALILWLIACNQPPLELAVQVVQGGIEAHASRPIDRVEAIDSRGAPLQQRRLDPPVETVFLAVDPRPGESIRVHAWAGPVQQAAEVRGQAGPVRVEVQAGDRPAPVEDGDVVYLPGRASGVSLALWSSAAREAVIAADGPPLHVALEAGSRWTGWVAVHAPQVVSVTAADGTGISFEVVDDPIPQGAIRLSEVAFPADAGGSPEPARSPDRVDLPAAPWRLAMRLLGLGWRPRADLAPWAWQGIALASDLPAPVDVVVRSTFLDGEGRPDPAFASRLREGREPEVLAVARIPARGEARVVLPVYVDGDAIRAAGLRTARIEVLPLAGGEAVATADRPVVVARAGAILWISALIAALSASGGWALLAARWRRWMAASTAGELVAIGLLGTLAHAIGVAFQLAGFGFAMVLGPFAPFLTGIPDDAIRACVYATLLVLYPRPGVVALATVVGSLVRAVILGAVHPVDLVFLGANVFWLEAGAAIAGLSRAGWRDASPLARWARLSLGLSFANAALTATGIVVGAVVYRLFYAPSYVIGLVALPGAVYVALGCGAAVGFADSLKRVAP